METFVVPNQTVEKDSFKKDLIDMIFEWEMKTGPKKDEYYFRVIFLILSALGCDEYYRFDFFKPFADKTGYGFNFENVPPMTKQYYLASFNTIIYAINKIEESSGIPGKTLIYGALADLTEHFRTRVTGRERVIDLYKSYQSSPRPGMSIEGINMVLNKMQSDQHVLNIKNQLEVWEELLKKYFKNVF